MIGYPRLIDYINIPELIEKLHTEQVQELASRNQLAATDGVDRVLKEPCVTRQLWSISLPTTCLTRGRGD